MKIALVGAFDRNNYGDILMPIVLKKQIEQRVKSVNNIQFDYYGLSYANMKYTGGYDTNPFYKLYNQKYDVVIFVGGEVLTSKYTGMYLNLQSSKLRIFTYKVFRRLFYSMTENWCRKKLKMKSLKPWIVDKKELGCKRIIYNTVGGDVFFGVDKKDRSDIIECIKKIDYISLREKETYNVIKKINNNAKMYPDSVISLSKVISKNEITSNVSSIITEKVHLFKDYIVFQINKKQGKKNVGLIVKQLEKIVRNSNLKVILLPIGYAQGHEDNDILRRIYRRMDPKYCFIPDFNNIYETMYIISNSKLYVGTSLHGAITAITYGVPHIALTNNIKKLLDFLSTWNSTPIVSTSIGELSMNVEKILSNYEVTCDIVKRANNRMNELVDINFDEISSIVEDGCNE